jgi:hypothetical protein
LLQIVSLAELRGNSRVLQPVRWNLYVGIENPKFRSVGWRGDIAGGSGFSLKGGELQPEGSIFDGEGLVAAQ